MINLFLTRHGETAWNARGRFQGQTDVPLNEKGRQQAEALAKRLAAESFAAIYASDLKRARETAEIIAQNHACPLIPEPRLREISFGQWEGSTYAELQQRYPEAIQAWHADIANFTPPGGESLPQFAERVTAAYRAITQKHNDETVLLVAHGGSLQMLLTRLLGMSADRFWQLQFSHCALTKVAIYEEGAILNLFNDTHHLVFS